MHDATAQRNHAHQNGMSAPAPPLLVRHDTAEHDHAHQNRNTPPPPPLLVHHTTARGDPVHQNGWSTVVAVAWAMVLAAGCSAVDGSETALPEPDFAPSIVLLADGDTVTPTAPDGREIDPETCRGEVGRVENAGPEPGRWVGTGVFDTGILDPEDNVTLVFREAGAIEWRNAPTDPGGGELDESSDESSDEDADEEEPSGPVLLTLEVREC